MILINNIPYLRKQAKISHSTIAKLLNVSVYTYDGYESGRLEYPSEIEILFCRLLGISVNDLYCECTNISDSTLNIIEHLSHLSDDQQVKLFTSNVLSTDNSTLNYQKIRKIKEDIQIELKNTGASK